MVVVVLPPGVQGLLGVDETQEPALRQALLSEPPIEGLDEGIVAGLAGPAEVELDAVPVRPVVEGAPGELGAVVERNHARHRSLERDAVQGGGDVRAREPQAHDEAEALPRVGVQNRQHPDRLPGAERAPCEGDLREPVEWVQPERARTTTRYTRRR
jgi:hypothetical protein